jgi:spermidine synthase
MRSSWARARLLAGGLLVLGLGFLLDLITPSGGGAVQLRLLHQTDSLYHHVMVMEDAQGLRYLSFNRTMGHQSVVKPGHPEHLTFAYTKSGFAALAFLDRPPAKALFVGLGGGSMPMYLRLVEPQSAIDIVEIDPEVTRVAEKYLGFRPDPAMKVFTQDGRIFLKRNPQRYDLIFLDAYNDQAVPFHLTTREFLELVKSRLNPGGVVASNIWSADLNRFFTAQIKTYQAVFPQLYLLRAGGGGNYIFLALAEPGKVEAGAAAARARALARERPWSFDLAELVEAEYDDYSQQQVEAPVLSDDYAPVNLMRHQKEKSPQP